MRVIVRRQDVFSQRSRGASGIRYGSGSVAAKSKPKQNQTQLVPRGVVLHIIPMRNRCGRGGAGRVIAHYEHGARYGPGSVAAKDTKAESNADSTVALSVLHIIPMGNICGGR